MASTNSDQFGAKVPRPGAGMAGNLKVMYGSIEVLTNWTDLDTVNFFTCPKGFTPLFGRLVGDNIDTGTEELEIDIGISGDTTKYLDSGVLATGDAIANEKITLGVSIPLQEEFMTVKPTAFTSDTDIIATIKVNAATFTAGTLTLWMCGMYNDARVV